MLKTDRVQNLIRDLTKHNVHDRQNLEINDDVNLVLFLSSSIFEWNLSSSLSFLRLRLLSRSSRFSSNWSRFRLRLNCLRCSLVVWYFLSQIMHILTMMMTTFLIFNCAFNWILLRNEFETKMITIMTSINFLEIERLMQMLRNRLIA
jgi:hypothetical protein